MSETTKKRPTYNREVVQVLHEEYELSKVFIRQSIRGDKTSHTAETIKKNYYKMANATKVAIQEFKNGITKKESRVKLPYLYKYRKQGITVTINKEKYLYVASLGMSIDFTKHGEFIDREFTVIYDSENLNLIELWDSECEVRITYATIRHALNFNNQKQ